MTRDFVFLRPLGLRLAPYGVTYTTTAQAKDYEFEDWGSYNVIGFQAEKYFAGYITKVGS